MSIRWADDRLWTGEGCRPADVHDAQREAADRVFSLASVPAPATVARRLSMWWVAGLVVVACWILLTALPLAAYAQGPACPTAPGDYTGSDQVVDELRDLRIDQAAICDRLADLVGDVDANITAGRTHSDVVPAKLDAVVSGLDQVHDDLVADDGVTSTVALSSTDRELAQDAQLGLHSALWLIGGLLVGLFVAGRVWEVFRA